MDDEYIEGLFEIVAESIEDSILRTMLMSELFADKAFLQELGETGSRIWVQIRIAQVQKSRDDLRFGVTSSFPSLTSEMLERQGGSIATAMQTAFLNPGTLREEVRLYALRLEAAISAVEDTYNIITKIDVFVTREEYEEETRFRNLLGGLDENTPPL
jgi:hypothetical protein